MDILANAWKREQKVQNNDSNKNNYTTEYWVRLEPGTFAMRSERHTTTPTDRMKSQGVE